MRNLYIGLGPHNQPIALESSPKQAFLTFGKIGVHVSHALEIDPSVFRGDVSQAHGLILKLHTGHGNTSWGFDDRLQMERLIAKLHTELEPGLQIVSK